MCGGGCGIAGNDQYLGSLLHQRVQPCQSQLADLCNGPRAVRGVSGVAQVHDVLVRELVNDGAGDG